jgi:penicillin-binding protein 2
VPSKQWRNQLFAEEKTERPWSAGDNVQLATGQGDLQTNPLQLAIAYAAVGNGGTIVTPHVGMEVRDAAGRVLHEFDPKPRRQVKIDPRYREVILQGLHDAAQEPGGTSYAIFGGFPVQVAGKTGTAQRPPHPDQSWYAVLAPYPNPRIVTIVTFEGGGFGADTAAPAALSILEAYFHKHATEISGANGGSPG